MAEYGFVFSYNTKNHRLKLDDEISDGALVMCKDLWGYGGNPQNIFVTCGQCNDFMIYAKGIDGDLSGHWVCAYCFAKVKEESAYHELERINDKYLKEEGLDGYDNDDEFY